MVVNSWYLQSFKKNYIYIVYVANILMIVLCLSNLVEISSIWLFLVVIRGLKNGIFGLESVLYGGN